MPTEEKLESIQRQIEKKIALINKNMTKAELAALMGETRFSVNHAIKGNNTKRVVRTRKKTYKVLGMED